MKRLTETDKWKDNFYMELHPYAKLLLAYMYDNCNDSGFIDYNQNLWLTQIKGELKDKKRYSEFTRQDLVYALEDLQSKLLSDKKKKLFIKDFLLHQGKLPLIKGNDEHDLIISKLESNLSKFNDAPEIKKILDNIKLPEPIEEVKSNGKKKRGDKFVAPTFEELKEYYLSEKPDAELSAIQDIYDHYVGCGWVVGKDKPMKDWEACVRRAIRNNEKGFRYNGNKNNSGEVKKSRTETTLSVVQELTKRK
jgi:hypothetical protein